LEKCPATGNSLAAYPTANVRQALRLLDAMAPCVAFLDEIDKGFSGVASSGQTDSGVGARLFSSFLCWLNDHTSDVFTVATCNDIAKLPPEFSRAQRFDGIFFVDLPGPREKELIWQLYLRRFGLDAGQRLPASRDWTGAEVESCCRLAALLDVPLLEAAQQIVPVAVTAGEAVERLRTWASGRCLDADRPGLYTRGSSSSGKPGRNVSRDASAN
jgi:SpoVK/Ycf46/Vps4 family AAA+-type ATPase